MFRKGWHKESFRHEMSAKGIKTKRPRIKFAKEQDQKENRYILLPEFLYHGTSIENAKKIIKEGFKARTPEDKDWKVGEITKEMGHYDDTFYNVSLAKREKDAIFFAVSQFGHIFEDGKYRPRTQVIFEIDTSKLESYNLLARDLFDTKGGEIKHIGPISPKAINLVHVRRFAKYNNEFKVWDHYYDPHDTIPWEKLE